MKSTKAEVAELLGNERHATSTHVQREWKHIVDGGAATILNALEAGDNDLQDLLAQLSQGWGRSPAQSLRVLSMLSGGGVIDGNLSTRARLMIRTMSRRLFLRQIDEVRDGSECGLARNEATEDARGTWQLVDRCKKTDAICRQDQYLGDRSTEAQSAAQALKDHSLRSSDRKMGDVMLKALRVVPDRKGSNCYQRTGDISIALECSGDEVLLTTDRSYEIIGPAIGIEVKRISASSGAPQASAGTS